MKKIFYILFIFFTYLKAFYVVSSDGLFDLKYPVSLATTTQYSCASGWIFAPLNDPKINSDHKGYNYIFTYKSFSELNLNPTCVKNNLGSKWGSALKAGEVYCVYSSVPLYYFSSVSFCTNKSGYTYSSVLNAWVPNSDSNSSILCPSGKQWNSKDEQCEEPPKDCNYFQNLCNKKCNGYVKSFQCSSNNPSSYTCECETCSDLSKLAINYCLNKNEYLTDFHCNESNGSIISATKNYVCAAKDDNKTVSLGDKNLTCYANQDIVIDYDANGSISNVYCEDINNSSSDYNSTSESNSNNNNFNNSSSTQSSNNSSSSTQSSNNSSSSIQSSNNSSSSTQSSNNTCPNPCSLQSSQPLGFTTSLSSVDGYTCYTITNPQYNSCVLKYHFLNGICISGCSNSSGSNSNSNSDIGAVTSRLDNINNNIKKTNDILNDIKNLKPDSNSSISGHLSDTASGIINIANNLKDFYTNTKNNLDNLKNAYDKVSSLISDPSKAQLNILQSDAVSCPITSSIYSKSISVDPCKFIAPYKPFIQLFFTIYFSFIAVFYFIDRVIVRRD